MNEPWDPITVKSRSIKPIPSNVATRSHDENKAQKPCQKDKQTNRSSCEYEDEAPELAKPQPICIIIIERDRSLRMRLESCLKGVPEFCCVSAFDEERDLKVLLETRARLAIVGYPQLFEEPARLLWQSKDQSHSFKILALVDFKNDRAAFDAISAGADGLVDKPIHDWNAFLLQVKQVLAGEMPISNRVKGLLLRHFQRSRPKPWLLSKLTKRERDVADLACSGLTCHSIAQVLGIALATVQTHEKNIHQKLGIHCRTELQLKLLDVQLAASCKTESLSAVLSLKSP